MNKVYDIIKNRLDDCKTIDDYKTAYKWLAQRYVELNEEAIRFEKKVENKIGERELNIIIYGSEEAYQKDLDFREKMKNAETKEMQGELFLDYIKNFECVETEDYPKLWEDFEIEEELEI